VDARYAPTRNEALLHVAGVLLLVVFIVALLIKPWSPLPGLAFLGSAACIGLMYWLAIQRRTNGKWIADFTFESIREQGRLWRYIWSPSGIARSAAIARRKK
jgi:hypothetical protein